MNEKKPADASDMFIEAVGEGDARRVRSALAGNRALATTVLEPPHVPEGIFTTVLHVAVCRSHDEVARLLVEAGADVNALNCEGRTPLHDALEHGSNVRGLLLDAGAEVDICAASFLGRLDRMAELLDRDPELANDRGTGLSPLGWAAYAGQPDAAQELTARGARMDDGELLCAASVNGVAVGRVLLRQGADPNGLNEEAGGTALHAAASMQHSGDGTPFIRLLLEAGADVTARTKGGKTAREIAEMGARRQQGAPPQEQRAYEAAIELLRAHGG